MCVCERERGGGGGEPGGRLKETEIQGGRET